MSNSDSELKSVTPMLPAGKDMQAALEFYMHTLGFTPTYQADDLSLAILRRDTVEIILQDSDDPHTAAQTSLRIQASGVEALHAEFQARNIPPFHQPAGAGLTGINVTPWGTREFAVRDLAGVCITFYERLSNDAST